MINNHNHLTSTEVEKFLKIPKDDDLDESVDLIDKIMTQINTCTECNKIFVRTQFRINFHSVPHGFTDCITNILRGRNNK